MDFWEARYRALATGITDKDMIDCAEVVVEKAIGISNATGEPLENIIHSMLAIATAFNELPKPLDKKTLVKIWMKNKLTALKTKLSEWSNFDSP